MTVNYLLLYYNKKGEMIIKVRLELNLIKEIENLATSELRTRNNMIEKLLDEAIKNRGNITKKDLSLAKLGIIALVDEATKYQEVRDKKGLRKIYKKIIKEENK